MKISSLRTRILFGALLLSVIIGVVLTLAVVLTFEIAERKFFEAHYTADIETFIKQYHIDSKIIDLPRENFQVYVAEQADFSTVPQYIIELPRDSYNVTIDGRVYDYQKRSDGKNTYFFLFDEDDSDAFERSLLVFSAVMSAIFIVISLLIGQSLGRHIIQPLTALANRVSQFDAQHHQATAAPQSSIVGDEIRALERSIDDYHERISSLLKREQEFSADVSHELRTPLMAMQGATEILKQRAEKEHGGASPVLNRIERGCIQMTSLTEALLYLAREPHNFKDLVQMVSVKEVIDEQLLIVKEIVDSRGISVEVEGSQSEKISAIPAVLNIVIGNIIKNAVKHTDQQLINITVSTNGVVVQDYGPGIEKAEQAKVFDRYRRANDDDKHGSGIGLSLVKRFCNQYGWHIDLDSKEGKGTRVTLVF